MAKTVAELKTIAEANGNLTLAQIRDSLPSDLDVEQIIEVAARLDQKHFTGMRRAEIVAICLACLTANLLPD